MVEIETIAECRLCIAQNQNLTPPYFVRGYSQFLLHSMQPSNKVVERITPGGEYCNSPTQYGHVI